MKVYINLTANDHPQVLYTLKFDATKYSTFSDIEKFAYGELEKVNVLLINN